MTVGTASSFLLVLLCIVGYAPHLVLVSATMQRVTVSNAQSRFAIANDGSDAVFYFRPSTEKAAADAPWLLYLEGGFYCANAAQCAQRWQQSPQLMSSTALPPTSSDDTQGIFGTNASANPFSGFNTVFMSYLSSDLYLGNASKAETQTDYEFRGRPSLTAVVEDILTGFTLNGTLYAVNVSSNPKLLVTGSSAGGMGALFNANYLGKLARSLVPKIEFRVAPDSAFFMAGVQDPFASVAGCQESVYICPVKGMFGVQAEFWNIHDALDENCRRDMKLLGKPEYTCLDGPVAAKYLKEDVFFMEYGFDAAELLVDGCTDMSCKNQTGGIEFMTKLTQLKRGVMSQYPSFMPTCLGHEIAVGNQLMTSMPVGNVSLAEALRRWYFAHETVSYMDDCSEPGCRSAQCFCVIC